MKGVLALSAVPRRVEPVKREDHPQPSLSAFGPPPDKTLGEFSELTTNYEGSFRPARVGLRLALAKGKMNNPLEMKQSKTPWSARRPGSSGGDRMSLGRNSPRSIAGSAVVTGNLTVEALTERDEATADLKAAIAKRDVTLIRAATEVAVQRRVDPRLLEQARRRLMEAEQRVERGPGVLRPQRIELPAYLNTPARRVDGDAGSAEDRTMTHRRLQDLELLTGACKRANKVREEGRAHFSMGVLRDNLAQYQKAIDCYNKFLRICKGCNDSQGCALAYHCIAVDHQLLGDAEAQMLRKAIFFHNKHREQSDSVGKFVAHLNMGLAYAKLDEPEASTVNHQYALRYALQLHSQEGQSLAIGSLGFSVGMYDRDPEKMRLLVERYMELCDSLKQPRNQATALRKLGIIASQQGDSEQSISYFQQAIESARAQGDREAEKDCSVRLGIATGQSKMAEHIGSILEQAVVGKQSHL